MYNTDIKILEQSTNQEIRIIKQVVDNDGIITNIYENMSVERFYPKLLKKVVLNQKESLDLFNKAQEEIEFAFRKKGVQRGAVKWKK